MILVATTITIRIFFTGLIAFTPDEFSCGEKVRALLVDTTNPPVSSDGCHLHTHEPNLFFYSPDCGPCEKDGRLCRCSLAEDRYLLDLPRDTDKKEAPLCWEQNYTNPDVAPNKSNCSGLGFRYVPRMKDLRVPLFWVKKRAKLKQSCNRECPADLTETPICNLVTGQVNFRPAQEPVTCLLSGENGYSGTAPELKTEPLNTGNFWDADSQLTAEIIRFTHTVESAFEPSHIEITFVNFDRTASFPVKIPVLRVQNVGSTADLIIGNIMSGEPPEGRCNNGSLARDFELFHDLARNPLPPSDRPIPQISHDASIVSLPPGVGGSTCDDSLLFRIYKADFLRAGKARAICPETTIDY